MAHDDGAMAPRKGKLSAFALLKSWLFDKKSSGDSVQAETEFLNTRDGYELAKFAQKAFGGDEQARKAHEAAVAAEQAEIDALLRAKTDVVAINHAPPVSTPPTPMAPVQARVAPPPPPPPPAAPVPPPAPSAAEQAAAAKAAQQKQLDLAVRHLENLRDLGLSVETLAEALIVIESREVRQRAAGGH